MLITFVMARKTGDNSLHIQATGPSFPQGYMSGDLNDAWNVLGAGPFYVPSMRGSNRLYVPLVVTEEGARTASGALVANLAELCLALNAPSPAYNEGDTEAVQARIKASLQVAKDGPPKPAVEAPAAKSKREVFAEAVAAAAVAACEKLGISLN